MPPDSTTELSSNVAGLLREPVGATRTHELSAGRLAIDDAMSATGITGAARLLRLRTGILAEGDASGDVELECSKCLILFPRQVAATFDEEFRPLTDPVTGLPEQRLQEGEHEDDFSTIPADHVLDLQEVVRQAFVVSVPLNPLCSPDCAGLCPVCGADLNVENCGHHLVQADSPFAGLASLYGKLED